MAAAVKEARAETGRQVAAAVERALAEERQRAGTVQGGRQHGAYQAEPPATAAATAASMAPSRGAEAGRVHAALRAAAAERERGSALPSASASGLSPSSLHNAAVQRALAAGLARCGGMTPASAGGAPATGAVGAAARTEGEGDGPGVVTF